MSGACPGCDGSGYHEEDELTRVTCPDCAGTGKAENSITVNEKLRDDTAELVEALREARQALAFAASVIKSGEPWTLTCEEVIGGALAKWKAQK